MLTCYRGIENFSFVSDLSNHVHQQRLVAKVREWLHKGQHNKQMIYSSYTFMIHGRSIIECKFGRWMQYYFMCVHLEGHELGVRLGGPCVDLNTHLSANAEKLHLSMLHHSVVNAVLKVTNWYVAMAGSVTVILPERKDKNVMREKERERGGGRERCIYLRHPLLAVSYSWAMRGSRLVACSFVHWYRLERCGSQSPRSGRTFDEISMETLHVEETVLIINGKSSEQSYFFEIGTP